MPPRFKLKPERAPLLLADIIQSIRELNLAATIEPCKDNYRTRLRHELSIRNCNFSIKHVFIITYSTDSDAALICDPDAICGRKVTREFPGRQVYWRGDKKTLTELLCWFASETNRDFNLQIEIQNNAFSSGDTPEELEQLNEQVSFIAYCEYPADG